MTLADIAKKFMDTEVKKNMKKQNHCSLVCISPKVIHTLVRLLIICLYVRGVRVSNILLIAIARIK